MTDEQKQEKKKKQGQIHLHVSVRTRIHVHVYEDLNGVSLKSIIGKNHLKSLISKTEGQITVIGKCLT